MAKKHPLIQCLKNCNYYCCLVLMMLYKWLPPVSAHSEKIDIFSLKTEQGNLRKPLIPFRNLSQLL